MTASRAAPSSADRVVLLDRDGTLVVDRHYLADPAGLEFLPRAAEGLRRLHKGGWRLVIISNQSGVGRGFLTAGQLDALNARLHDMVREAGAELAGIYCCPHVPQDACACRKPGTLLVEQAAAALQFDPRRAIVIGDKDSDMELGRRLGARTILITPSPQDSSPSGGVHSTAADLVAAAELVESWQNSGSSTAPLAFE